MGEKKNETVCVYVCVYVSTPYLSELPDDSRGPGVLVPRTVPHPNVGLTLGHFSTQLCHWVETDLLLRCVFKVLVQERGIKWLNEPFHLLS